MQPLYHEIFSSAYLLNGYNLKMFQKLKL